MKKSLLALAVLGAFAGAASAQSSVTLYGVADANITAQKGGGERLWSVGSGGLNGSRFGLRGSEDLGGGLKANFTLENGYNIDTGTTAQSNNTAVTTTTATGARLFGRQAWVGVGGSFGEIRLGRQYTPIGALTDELGPLGTKGADLFAVANSVGNTRYRTDNAINYLSPNIAGLTINAQYSFQFDGAEQNKPNEKAGRQYGINALYKGGPFQAGIAYFKMEDTSLATPLSQEQQAVLLYGGLTFGGFTAKLAYEQTDIEAAKDRKIYGVTFEAPLGPVNLAIGLAQSKDTSFAAGSDDDANLATVQLVYDLSKRTALYTFYTHVDNDTSTNLGFNGPAFNKNSNQFQVGVRHRF